MPVSSPGEVVVQKGHTAEVLIAWADPANPKPFSSWPDGPTGGHPRALRIVVTKDDGGRIGS